MTIITLILTSTFSTTTISSDFLAGFIAPKIFSLSGKAKTGADCGVGVCLKGLAGNVTCLRPALMLGGNIAVRPARMCGGTWNALRHIFSQQAGHRAVFVHFRSFHCCDRTIGGTLQFPETILLLSSVISFYIKTAPLYIQGLVPL